MKKALRILNDVTYDAMGVPMFHSSCVSDDIEEAKTELEALKSRSCKNCRKHVRRADNYGECRTLHMTTPFDWFCADYAPKDTQC